MVTATPPNTACRELGPTNGICTVTSTSSRPLATSTTSGAARLLRKAARAAILDGTATEENSHTAGSRQVSRPRGSRFAIGGAYVPSHNWIAPASPLTARALSTATKVRRNGSGRTARAWSSATALR